VEELLEHLAVNITICFVVEFGMNDTACLVWQLLNSAIKCLTVRAFLDFLALSDNSLKNFVSLFSI